MRFLDRGVAAADDRDPLAPIEKTVAGRAGRDPAAAECRLGIESEVARGGTGRDDERVTGVFAIFGGEPERAAAEFNARHVIGGDLDAEALGMAAHAVHEVGTQQAVDIARPVVDFRRRHQLAPGLQARR